MANLKIPNSWQGLLWSVPVKDLDKEEDKSYIIHQVLSYGSLKQIKRLFDLYSLREIQEVFLKSPRKVYTFPIFYFVKDFVLNLGGQDLNVNNYVKTTSRIVK